MEHSPTPEPLGGDCAMLSCSQIARLSLFRARFPSVGTKEKNQFYFQFLCCLDAALLTQMHRPQGCHPGCLMLTSIPLHTPLSLLIPPSHSHMAT